MRFLCVWCVQVRRRAPRLSRGYRSMRSSVVLHLAHLPQRRLAPPTCISHSFPPSSSTDHDDTTHTHTHTHAMHSAAVANRLSSSSSRATSCTRVSPAHRRRRQEETTGKESTQVAASYPLLRLRLRHSTVSRLQVYSYCFMTDTINIRKVYKC